MSSLMASSSKSEEHVTNLEEFPKKGRTFGPKPDNKDYTIRKRLPVKWPRRKNDVYVTRKTPFPAQLERCKKLLESGESEVFIHGLGAAVSRAVHLALQVKDKCQGSVDVDVKTSTANLCDDLIPEVDHVEADWRTRNCSAIHIRVFRPVVPVQI